jgi:CRP-like cAMP-binding protein
MAGLCELSSSRVMYPDQHAEMNTSRHYGRSVPNYTNQAAAAVSQHLLRGVSSVDQNFQLFSECVLFRHVERREIEALFTRIRIRDFAASETIFVIGSPADSMMIVLRGTVQISVTPPKAQPLLTILSPGEIFGEVALLDGSARLADAIASTDCSLAIVDRHDMLAFLEQNPGAWQDIVSVLRERSPHLPIIIGREGRRRYAELVETALRHEERARMR